MLLGLMIFFCFRFPVVLFGNQGSQSVRQHVSVESSSLPIHSIKPYLFVYHDESLTS